MEELPLSKTKNNDELFEYKTVFLLKFKSK